MPHTNNEGKEERKKERKKRKKERALVHRSSDLNLSIFACSVVCFISVCDDKKVLASPEKRHV